MSGGSDVLDGFDFRDGGGFARDSGDEVSIDVVGAGASERDGDELSSGGGAELPVEVLDVIVHGVGGAIEFLGDDADGVPEDESFEDEPFAFGEPVDRVGFGAERVGGLSRQDGEGGAEVDGVRGGGVLGGVDDGDDDEGLVVCRDVGDCGEGRGARSSFGESGPVGEDGGDGGDEPVVELVEGGGEGDGVEAFERGAEVQGGGVGLGRDAGGFGDEFGSVGVEVRDDEAGDGPLGDGCQGLGGDGAPVVRGGGGESCDPCDGFGEVAGVEKDVRSGGRVGVPVMIGRVCHGGLRSGSSGVSAVRGGGERRTEQWFFLLNSIG